MEEDQEFKHVCKFCSKSFPCGRSLGGHMRSHVANVSSETEEKEKLALKKLSSLNNINGGGAGGGGGDTGSEAGTNTNANTGYGLRENPKKTWRLADSKSEDTLLSDKFCKVCGKGFHSWKALFGHMKCHSEKERVSNSSLDDQDSWTNATQKLVVDSQSDNEATAPNRRRRSKRRTRYVTAAAATAGAASSVCEAEQEQEEVAMSLMMLSRDVGSWGGLNSVAESSDNNSAYFEAPSSVRTNMVSRIEGKLSIPSGTSELKKVAKGSDKKWELGNSVSSNLNSKGKSLERLADENPGNGFKMNITRVSIDEVIKNEKEKKSELDYQSALEDYEEKQGKNGVNGAELVSLKSDTNKYSSINTKVFDSELKSNSLKNWVSKTSEAESNKKSHKRGKFECTTCNKIFHSYQALGGHRASHKKIKGCFASRNESSENSIETHLSPEPTTESKLAKNSDNNEYLVEHELSAGLDNEGDTVRESNKSKGHVCPICLKDFPSGQALGGHKRSHLAGGGSESRNCQTVVLQEEPVPEIRDLLDLNLPAATEEESSSHGESYRPWWVVGGNHKQEALVGLMSN